MQIIIATNNKHKVTEMQEILSAYFPMVSLVTPSDLGIDFDPVEDGKTFEENATIKAKAAWQTGKIAIADDSGLCVNALNGEPGLMSARYSGEHSDSDQNNKKLLKNLENSTDRSAYFVCVIACILPDGSSFTVRGEVCGEILRELSGQSGFGYDPLFYYPPLKKTFAQLTSEEKNSVSHRKNALKLFAEKLTQLENGNFLSDSVGKKKKIGIYGGAFAPVHIGHMRAVDEFFEAVELDELLIMPTLISPHKTANYEDNPCNRLQMLHLAFEDHPLYGKKLFISDYEFNAPVPSYTVNTLSHFANFGELYFLCGKDMFLTLEEWKNPSKIFALATIVVINRIGEKCDPCIDLSAKKAYFEHKFSAKIIILNSSPIEISSSQIREGSDEIKAKYLCPKVYEFIKKGKIYE